MRHLSTVYKGKEDLLRMKEKINSHPPQQTLIQVYCGTSDWEEITLLRSTLKELFPGTGIIGASSAGEIVNAQVQKHSIVISFTLFDHTSVQTALIRQNDDLIAAGQAMAAAFEQDSPSIVIVFGSGLKNGRFVNYLTFLEELQKRLGGVLIAGGQSGGYEDQNSEVFVFSEEGLTKEGFAAAALSGHKLCAHTAFNLGWVPLGKKMTVTSAEGNKLYTIDGIPAGEIYKQYLGIESGPSSLYLINNFPLMTERGSMLTTHAISAMNEDGSFELPEGIRTGEQVQFSFCDVALQEESARQLNKMLEAYEPEVIFVYTCLYRMELFGEDIAVDMEALKCCKDTAGFFTFGEYFTQSNKRPYFFQQTMTVLALSEGDSCLVDKQHSIPLTFRKPGTDLRRFELLKVLSHLVASTTHELELMNRKLAEQAQKDGLTGLANRRLFDETLLDRLKEHSRSETTMSLILMDVDYFKQFNDFYGHVAGDVCLRGIAQVLVREVKRTSDMAFRYGGEEFGCILSFTDHPEALMVAESIRSGVEGLRLPHERAEGNEFVTVSLGVLSVVNPSPSLSPQKVIIACDNLLYRAKKDGRNRVVGQVFDQNDFYNYVPKGS